jgi:hypothetical protein
MRNDQKRDSELGDISVLTLSEEAGKKILINTIGSAQLGQSTREALCATNPSAGPLLGRL